MAEKSLPPNPLALNIWYNCCAAAQQLYQMFSAKGFGGKDFSAIINMYRTAQ